MSEATFGVRGVHVSTTIQDQWGKLWVGSERGIVVYDGQNQIYYGTDNGLSTNEINCLVEDRNQKIWVGTEKGLFIFDPSQEVFRQARYVGRNADPVDDKVSCLYMDRHNVLWVGLAQGAGRVALSEDTVNLMGTEAPVNTIYEDLSGILWVGTDRGLMRLDRNGRRLLELGNQGHAFTLPIFDMVETEKDVLWLATAEGLFRFSQPATPVHPGEVRFMIAPGNGQILLQDRNKLRLAFDPNQNVEVPLEQSLTEVGELRFLPPKGEGYQWFVDWDDCLWRWGSDASQTPRLVVKKLQILDPEGNLRDIDLVSAEPMRIELPESAETVAFQFGLIDVFGNIHGNYSWRYNQNPSVKGDHPVQKLIGENHEFTLQYVSAGEVSRQTLVIHKAPGTSSPSSSGSMWGWLLFFLALVVIVILLIQRLRLNKHLQAGEPRGVSRDALLAQSLSQLHTPLSSLMGISEGLLERSGTDLKPEMMESLAMLVNSGRRLNRMVTNILDYYRHQSETLDVRKKAVDIRSLTDVAIDHARRQASEQNVELTNETPADLPVVYGDEDRLLRILENLFDHALHYSQDSKITVRGSAVGDDVYVIVEDEGKTNPKQRIANLFKVGDSEGILNLSTTRKLVEFEGGRIWAEAAQGEQTGLTITCSFPTGLHTGTGGDTGTFPVPEHLPRQVQETALPRERFVILIVDDDRVNREVLRNLLAVRDYDTLSAENGPDALKILETEHVDLILLDIMMPRMSGFEVCREVRKIHPVAELPIIFLTAKTQTEDVVVGFEVGANDYLTKPISKPELIARVRTHLGLLDIHRNLEHMVTERTEALAARNQELVTTQDQLVMQQKMASLGTLTAGIAHEIKNPLNFINNFSDFTQELATEIQELLKQQQEHLTEAIAAELDNMLSELEENASFIKKYGVRANHIVESMMELAQGKKSAPQKCSVNSLVTEFSKIAFHGKKGIEINANLRLELDESLGSEMLVAQSISRVIINLVNNSMDALQSKKAHAGETFQPELLVATRNEADHFEIIVRDNGDGIANDDQEKIFTPFYTTKPTGQGNIGLGLAITYEIVVDEHGGKLHLETEPGEYTAITIRLPKKLPETLAKPSRKGN